MRAVISGIVVIDEVTIPLRSSSAWTRPTVWWHTGHMGTSNARSTLSADS